MFMGCQVSSGRAATLAILLHHLHTSESFHGRAVLISTCAIACLEAGLDKHFAERIGGGMEAYVERAILAVQRVVEMLVVLSALEQRQYVLITPARVAQCRPAIEILRVTTVIGHGIDR
ncbi:hypothetical protein D3C76_516420 [compost metagenome]